MSLNNLGDPGLIAALKRLDDQAWRELHLQVSPRLLSLIKQKLVLFGKYLSIKDEAEEIVAETFRKAIEYIGSYDPQKGKITTWICTIAFRITYDVQRNIEKKISLQQYTGKSTSIAHDVNTQTVEQLLVNINVDPSMFSETERMYLKAMYIEELSDDIIASECRVGQPAVRKARQRLLAKLCRLMEQQQGKISSP